MGATRGRTSSATCSPTRAKSRINARTARTAPTEPATSKHTCSLSTATSTYRRCSATMARRPRCPSATTSPRHLSPPRTCRPSLRDTYCLDKRAQRVSAAGGRGGGGSVSRVRQVHLGREPQAEPGAPHAHPLRSAAVPLPLLPARLQPRRQPQAAHPPSPPGLCASRLHLLLSCLTDARPREARMLSPTLF